jgi:photosystem II stability/assembly factor-like uncharacterized protein
VPSTAWAGINVWTSQGPKRVLDVTALAIAPTTPSTLYAHMSDGSVSKSTDGGGSWNAAAAVPQGFLALPLLVDPATPTTLYAAAYSAGDDGGVFKSTDGAVSWQAVNNGLPCREGQGGCPNGVMGPAVRALVIDPTTPTTLYVGTQYGGVDGSVDGSGAVFKSTDGAASWQAANGGLLPAGGGGIGALAIDPVTPTTLYAGTFGGGSGGVFKSSDAGGSWRAVNSGLPGLAVTALAIAPTTPRTVYAGMEYGGRGVFKSTDGGASWRIANTGLPSDVAVIWIVVDPVRPSTLYAGMGDGGVFKSMDSGGSWTATRFPGLPVFDPSTPGTLYVGAGVGVFKSTDAGGTWQAVNTGLPEGGVDVSMLAVDPIAPRTLYAAGSGVYKTTDGGESWQLGLSDGVTLLAIDPTMPDTIYAGATNRVFKSTDAGHTWNEGSADPTPAAYAYIYALAIAPTTPSTLYAGTLGPSRGQLSLNSRERALGGQEHCPSGVYESTDGAGSWQVVNSFPCAGVVALVVDPSRPSTLYAGTGYSGVFKSTDGAASWQAVNTGLPNGSSVYVGTLVIDPTTPTTLYAGTGGGLFKSIDGGNTWNAADSGLPEDVYVYALALDPSRPGKLYATAQGLGVFKSTDGAESWRPVVSTGLPGGIWVHALAIAPTTPTTLYAATDRGVFAIEQVPPPCAGDCNDSGNVSINEIVTLVSIGLGSVEPAACPSGVPDGAEVDIALIIRAVNNALHDCGGG